MQLKCYILADDLEERESNRNKYLQTCDIVCLYNRDINLMLGVQKRNINKYFKPEKRKVLVQDNDDDIYFD